MRYSKVFLDAIGYDLPPNVVTSSALESRLAPLYDRLRIPMGQVEGLTGIKERRWWDAGFKVSTGAVDAARQALEISGVSAQELGAVVYGGVCRENHEPATACAVAHALGVGSGTAVFDVANACLGALSGLVAVANMIELGQIKAGLVVSCESAREINDAMIQAMLEDADMERFRLSLATLTGGSGAVAMVLTDGSVGGPDAERHRVLGGAMRAAPEHHGLCRWGADPRPGREGHDFMETDGIQVLKHGVTLGAETWQAFLPTLGWREQDVNKVICHQVGAANRSAVLGALGVSVDKDFSTFEYLGNIGTVSVPLTAAIASERGFLRRGERVGWLGIGSGLNCLMLGLEW